MSDPDVRLGRAVFLILLAIYLATFNGLPGVPDGEVSYQTTSSLARGRGLALGGTPEADGLIEFSRTRPPGGFSVRAGHGDTADQWFGWFGVGQAALAVPLHAIGRGLAMLAPGIQSAHEESTRYGVGRSEYFEHLVVGLRNPLLVALTGMLVVLLCRSLGSSKRLALLSALGFGLTTFAWPQARGDASDVQATFFATWALYLFTSSSDSFEWRRHAWLGVALGWLLLTRIALAPLALGFDILLLLRLWRRRRFDEPAGSFDSPRRCLIAFGIPQVIALALLAFLNWQRFGSALDSGYGPALQGGLFGGEPGRALLGLLVSPGRGLLWMAPGLLAIPYGLAWAKRQKRRDFVGTVALIFFATILPLLFLRGWHGAWSYGPRYLMPALPALWVLASLGFQRSSLERRPRPLVLALLAIGLVVQLPGVLVDQMTYHDLAVRAAPDAFEFEADLEPAERSAREFEQMQFDWGFAGPWAHWRILRHRVAHARAGEGASEGFAVAEIFLFPSGAVLRPSQARERGFGHLAWVDLRQRLEGSIWPAVALIGLLALGGVLSAARALDA